MKMAEALRALEDLKECPVCRDEFTDPRALPCDHSFCQDCIDRIKKGLRIRCPVCNADHDVRKVRCDFKLMQFFDALKEEKEAKTTKKKGKIGLHKFKSVENVFNNEYIYARDI